MSVIIKIEGREAIPVRAIPLLTYWQTVTPDALAQALAGDEHFYPFEGMKAHRVNGGAVIRQTYWESLARELRALSDTIRTTEINHETGLQQYRIESLKKLPPSVYLWLDEFATAHARHYRLNNIVHPMNEDVKEIELTEEQAHRLTEKRLDCVTLDLDPMADADLLALAMEGFELIKSLPVASAAVVAKVELAPLPSVVDTSLLATRKQLIEAFGAFTGMKANWFHNIKDTPALLAARKVTGQGGRGHIEEPLFCPYEVTQWLINPARRKGRTLGRDKGWELFERNFPRAYAAFSVGDTRTD